MIPFLHIVPYSLSGSLASVYNELVEKSDSSYEWILITDADVMFVTPKYGHLISEVIAEHPEAGLFTCTTNRIGAPSQLTEFGLMQNDSILELRKIAVERQQKFGSAVTRISAPVSGLFILFSKTAWNRVGHFKGGGLFGVDWRFSRDISELGLPIFRMEGLFLIHFYRLDGRSAS